MQSSHHREKGRYGFSYPHAVVFLPEIRSYIETFEGDNSLYNILAKNTPAEELITIGKQLAILHRSNLSPAKKYLPSDELSLLEKWINYVKEYRYSSIKTIVQLYEKLKKMSLDLSIPNLYPSNCATCGRNFIFSNNKITLANWKEVALAPPEFDLAILHAYLEEKALDLKNDMAGFSSLREDVLEGYRGENGQYDVKTLNFFHASRLLLNGIYRIFHPQVEHLSATMFNRCRELL